MRARRNLGQAGDPPIGGFPTYMQSFYTPGYNYLPGYVPSSMFTKRIRNIPGQPYQMQVTPEQVEKAVYADVQATNGDKSPDKPKPANTDPQTVVKLEDGLEVPIYLIKRDIERKDLAEKVALIEATKPPFASISEFAEQSPQKAGLLAFVAGALIANYLY